MEIATEAMSALLPKLGELLKDEYNLDRHVRKGVKSLQTELSLMHVALRKVAGVPSDQLDEQVRIWAGAVRELSCDMEDSVDDFMVRVEQNQDRQPASVGRVITFLSMIKRLFVKGKDLHQISNAIQEAQDLAKELTEQRQRYELDIPSTSTGATVDPRIIALYKDVVELVGIDHTRDELIGKLIGVDEMSNEKQLKTISIVGFGGLGKTTLAKAVYDKIRVQFDCAAFVSVAQNPDIRKVLKDLLYELDKKKFSDIHNTARDEKQLIDELGEFLVDKRYLIIVDDIWEEKTWRYMKCAFSRNNLCSRIVTTTRKISVSESCLSTNNDIIYTMKPLCDGDSQILFYRRIFQHENGCPPELHEVSRDILKKCGGVPLAIITVASLLVSNQQIKQKDEWFHLLNSIGHGVTEVAIAEDMRRILLLSYYDLPYHLKACLLYLSIFPEDFKIKTGWLIRRWLAEGFVQCERKDCSLFEIGKSYLNDLINRSLVRPEEISDDGIVKSCRVHDMVLDLICSLSSQENFVAVLDNIERRTPNFQNKVRRLSLHSSNVKLDNYQLDASSMSKVRSFVTFCPPTCDSLPSLSSFRFLRVLDLGNSGGQSGGHCVSLKYVGKLLHLRYLGLMNADVDALPMDIGNLRFLQTLDIRSTCIKQLPATVVELRQLIYLRVDPGTRLPPGMGNLTSLEVMKRVMPHLSPHVVQELSHLTELRALTIDWYDMEEGLNKALVESLGKLRKLQYLNIYCGSGLMDLLREGWVPPRSLITFHSWEQGIRFFLKLPKWINSTALPLLCCLTIDVDEVQGDDIQIIGTLPSLRSLSLRALRAVGTLVVRGDAFPRARECIFMFPLFPSLFPAGAMPMVQRLTFSVSARSFAGGDVDCGMGHLPSLERITVHLLLHDDHGNRVASDEVRDVAKAALKHAADAHPNHPTIEIL
ncbi:putative disease resistance RPP13-like protein 3 [Hordeum vulgare]|uniref:RGH1 n=1 Tax=Hordeum vulgare subsp. vulgare TaxID=112509 RepID=M0XIJ5_HORVV|nr:disease resistance protein RGA5-like isoform X1 [Hordeum vulgare subsp. vulgare]KAE8773443.1 putative disease resistance RPP13-like protein 3 [Hordeum vulgare]